jgi:hypothetical protein
MTGFESKRQMAQAKLEQPEQEPCVGKDPRCPCQDGDACHYKDCGITKARPVPLKQQEQEPVVVDGNTSDGYHTFNELYEFRKAYNIALFNEWSASGKCSVHKSWRHNDGELCFGGGWFIVVAVLPHGQISNHYEAKYWDLFQIQETEKALFKFDGHTGQDVIARLAAYTAPPAQRTWVGLTDAEYIHIRKTTYNAQRGLVAFYRAIEAKLKEHNYD